jgi:hypothetical protein
MRYYYHFADLFFEDTAIRLLRPDSGQSALDMSLTDVVHIARQEKPERAVFILGPYGSNDSFITFRTQEEYSLWHRFASAHDIARGEFDWHRTWTEL